MTTSNSTKPNSETLFARSADPIPYFSRSASAGLWSHLSAHLELKRRATTTNPYLNPLEGFHTTFYEICEDAGGIVAGVKESRKHGPLYDHPLGWSFRKSAYTVSYGRGCESVNLPFRLLMVNKLYSPPRSDISEAVASPGFPNLVRHWTLLLLAPDHFFNENNLSFPIHSQTPQRVETMSHSFGRLHSVGAEMNLITQGLGRISERWAGRCFWSIFVLSRTFFILWSRVAILGKALYKAMRDWRSQAATLEWIENYHHVSWDVKADDACESEKVVLNVEKQPLVKW